MNPRYFPEVAAINQRIPGFNQYLNPAYQVPLLNVDRMIEEKSGVQIVLGNGDAFCWPNPDKRGVYFIFGREKTNVAKNGLYIGKASLSSQIGARLDYRLRPHKNSEWFEMRGYNNENYILDYIATINLDAISIGFMAWALEEYLITELKNSINLINGTGN
jgi:hypothetical protein